MAYLKEKMQLELEEAGFAASQALARYPKRYFWSAGIFLLLLIPGYFLVKSLSHRYWAGKYAASSISARPSFQNPLPITTGPVSITTAGEGTYSAAVLIANPNVDLSLDKVSYSLNFYNASNQLVKTVTDKFFLRPNEKKYLVAPKISSAEKIVSASVSFPQNLPWQKRLIIPKVNLTTSQPQLYNQLSPVAFVVEGNFQNQSPYALGQVSITFVLFDASGKILASSQRQEFTVKPFELRSYKQLWPGIYSTSAAKAEVLASTDTLDEQNVTLSTASQNSSDLSR